MINVGMNQASAVMRAPYGRFSGNENRAGIDGSVDERGSLHWQRRGVSI